MRSSAADRGVVGGAESSACACLRKLVLGLLSRLCTEVRAPVGVRKQLREVLEQLLADADWRAHLGAQARQQAENALSPGGAGAALRAAYDATISR